jgi:protein-disulfide isomerase
MILTRRRLAALAGAAVILPSALRAQDAELPAGLPEVAEMTLGAEDAPVTLIEYASFTCPHCARFHADVLPSIRAEYVEPGQVRYVYREVYFDRPGLWASMVARCGGGDRYFAIADMLYARQSEWTQGDPAAIAANLRRIGLSAGLAPETLDACLSDGAMAQALVANYEANAEADDVRATPSFVLDGEKLSNLSLPEMRERLDAAVAAAS